MADLEWINGGVPKGATDKTGTIKVQDAPQETTDNTGANQDIIVSHLITTTRIVNQYPENSVNYFYLNKNNQVCYYAYFLMKPSSRIHTATVECYSPAGIKVCKFDQQFQVGFTDRLLTIQNETYQWFLVTLTLGMDHLHPEYGQIGFPRDLGLYTIHLTVDGQKVGITFFYVKADDGRSPTPIATMVPAAPAAQSSGLPMTQPISKTPIPKSIEK
ncbi:MAG TPA: hypothetical protein VHE12_08755 [bacterium]|nr:hypothetical protein [bacterium]